MSGKVLVAATGQVFGPYLEIAVQTNGWSCDGNFLPLSVVGPATVEPYENQIVAVVEATHPTALEVQQRISADVDELYRLAVGNKYPEYQSAEAAAERYQAAGYAGSVPAPVASWAQARNWTTREAAVDILAAAARLRSLQSVIREKRLLLSYRVAEESGEQRSDTLKEWSEFFRQIKSNLN